MFGTSGIRGIANSEVSCELACQVGMAAGSLSNGKIAIGMDSRLASPMIKRAFASGAMASGCDVMDIGLVPTPLVSFVSKKLRCGAAMITASHNPKEYVGIKLFSKGVEYPREMEARVEKLVSSGQKPAAFDKTGSYSESDFREEYFSSLLSLVDAELIASKKPKVVVDCGNGAASMSMPYLLQKAGCHVVSVNSEPNGNFNRNLEPNAANLADTGKIVAACGAALGIAHDGDADRAIAIGDRGDVLALDTQLALMCESELAKKKGRIISTVEASLAVREAVEKSGGTLEITPVGSIHVQGELAKSGGVFGGEPCGEYVYPAGVPCPDGLLSGLKLIEIYCRKGSLSSLAAKAKAYPIHRSKFQCNAKHKAAAMKYIAAEVKAFPGTPNNMDGIRKDFEDGWFLIRPSGTEPAIRLTLECKSGKRLGEMKNRLEKIMATAVGLAEAGGAT
ncbi:MAG: phosphoglucosamine mutase [Candidatus Micrarchaeia archaeon]